MKKIGILVLILVVALGAMGLGYAHWSQTLLITETVNTGTFCVGIRDVGTNDPAPPLYDVNGIKVGEVHPVNPSQGTVDPGKDKNVAAAYSDNGTQIDDSGFYTSITETIVNAYPGYCATVTMEFGNCGTVPAKVSDWSVTPGLNGDYISIGAWVVYDNSGAPIAHGTGIQNLLSFLYCYQLDPGQIVTVDLEKCVLQEVLVDDHLVLLPYNATIIYTETITWAQWNVVQCPPPTTPP